MPGDEATAKILGYAGLIPFITLSIGSWIALPLISEPLQVLIAYAATILSFMGAIHWGIAMSGSQEQNNARFYISVLPALFAWLALLIPPAYALAIFIFTFTALYLYERFSTDSVDFPQWYLPMRGVLTLVVVACLTAALLASTQY